MPKKGCSLARNYKKTLQRTNLACFSNTKWLRFSCKSSFGNADIRKRTYLFTRSKTAPITNQEVNKQTNFRKTKSVWFLGTLYWWSKGSVRDRFEVFSWEKNTKRKRKNFRPVTIISFFFGFSLIQAWSKVDFFNLLTNRCIVDPLGSLVFPRKK